MRGAIEEGTGVPSFGGDASLWFRIGGVEGALVHMEHNQLYDPLRDPDAVFGGRDNDGRWVISGNALKLTSSISTFDPFQFAFRTPTQEASSRISTYANKGDMYARVSVTNEIANTVYDALPSGFGVVDTGNGRVVAPLKMSEKKAHWERPPSPLGMLASPDFLQLDAQVIGGKLVVKAVLERVPLRDIGVAYMVLLGNSPDFSPFSPDYMVSVSSTMGYAGFVRTATLVGPNGSSSGHDAWVNYDAHDVDQPVHGGFTVTIPLSELKNAGPRLYLYVASIATMGDPGFIFDIAPNNGASLLFPIVINTGLKPTTLGLGAALATSGGPGPVGDSAPASPAAPMLPSEMNEDAPGNEAAAPSPGAIAAILAPAGPPPELSGLAVPTLGQPTETVDVRPRGLGWGLGGSPPPTGGIPGAMATIVSGPPAASFVTLVSPTTLTYREIDGDLVTVQFSRPVLTSMDVVNQVFDFAAGREAVKWLRKIDLTRLPVENGVSVASGGSLTITAAPGGVGDGLADVGFVDATGIDLGAVRVEGDLGRISAGDEDTASTGLQFLTARSLGLRGVSTQSPGGALESDIRGALGGLLVESDVVGAIVYAYGGPDWADGRIGSVFVGGSLLGGKDDYGGLIQSTGDMGPVSIGGDLRGGPGLTSGAVYSGGALAAVTVGGSLRGGDGYASGAISSVGAMGPVFIGGNVRGGSGIDSGAIFSGGPLAAATVGGSLIGGAGMSSGRVGTDDDMGSVSIGGDIRGGSGVGSGAIASAGDLAAVTVGDSLIGGEGDRAGSIGSQGALGAVSIGGDVQGGSGADSGEVLSAGALGVVMVGGSVRGGSGDSSGTISGLAGMGPATIRGDLRGGEGNLSGQLLSGGALDVLTVGGSLVGGAGVASGTIFTIGEVGAVTIGGSVRGGSGGSSGALLSGGDMGPVVIHGDIRGGSGPNHLGQISSGGALASVVVDGSVVGGLGFATGSISSQGDMGPMSIGGDLRGGAGGVSGSIFSGGALRVLNVGGSLQGGRGLAGGSVLSLGDMGPVFVGGAIRGGEAPSAGQISSGGALAGATIAAGLFGGAGDGGGSVLSRGDMGPVSIHGDVRGGEGANSGAIFSGGALAAATVDGSLIGGPGRDGGAIFSRGDMGRVDVGGNVLGRNSSHLLGQIASGGSIAGVSVDGSLIGREGVGGGSVVSLANLGTVDVQGDIRGGAGRDSGQIHSGGSLAAVTVGGSLIGGAGESSGLVFSAGDMGPITVGGDLKGGGVSGTTSLSNSGAILSQGRIAKVIIGGSVISGRNSGAGGLTNSGAIRSALDIGPVSIGGGLVGNRTNPVVISARGPAAPPSGTRNDIAIESLEARGDVRFSNILGGYGVSGAPVNASAQIGEVRVGGDWIAGNLVAGASPGPNGFGDGDAPIETADAPGAHSRIGPIVIWGRAAGDSARGAHYGFVAAKVASLTVGQITIPLKPGLGNDHRVPVDAKGKVGVNEV